MQKVILHIQPQLRSSTVVQDFVQVDLMEEDLISLTQVIQDVKSIDKVFTDFSKTFNLPASKTNNKLFQYWYNPDIEGFDNQVMSNARIELNHFAFKEGKIRLESVVMRNGQPSLYKITFFGNTVKLNDLIGEDKLQNLVWLNNFNHEYSNANVKNGFEFGLNSTIDSVSYPDAIIYPLIAHSQQYIYDATNNTDSGLNISTNTTEQTKRGVFAEDLKPAILVKHIIKAIEEQYSLTFKSGEFFDSTHVFNLYMWLHRDKGKIEVDNSITIDNETFSCFTSSEIPSGQACTYFSSTSTSLFDNGTYKIQCIQDILEFELEVEVTPLTGFTSVEYTTEIVDSLTGVVVASKTKSGVSLLFKSYSNNFANFVSADFIEIGEKRNLVTRIRSDVPFNFRLNLTTRVYDFTTNSPAPTTGLIQAEFLSTTVPLSLSNPQINITDEIPDIKVLDFLNGLFKMFNLTSFVNFEGEIVVQRLDDFFASGQTLDLTEYIKTDEHVVNKTLPFSEVDLEYVEPNSILAQTFLNTNNRKYGEVEYKGDAKDKNIYKVTAPFEHMLYSRLSDLTSNAFTDVQTGCFLDEELNPSIGQPLLFYGVYRTGISTGINFAYCTRPDTYGALASNPALNFTLTAYWMPHHANELGSASTAPTFNLNFGSEIDTYNLTDYSGNNNSLFQKNYENYITRVFNKKTRLFNYKAVLPLKILLQLSLDDKVIVGTRLFTINSMTTKLQSGETEFELLNEAP